MKQHNYNTNVYTYIEREEMWQMLQLVNVGDSAYSLLSSFSITAIVNYHKLGGFKTIHIYYLTVP